MCVCVSLKVQGGQTRRASDRVAFVRGRQSASCGAHGAAQARVLGGRRAGERVQRARSPQVRALSQQADAATASTG